MAFVSASLYIIACTARNRMRQRLRRLREPRYLIGAIAGFTYLYFTIFARTRFAGPTSGPSRRRSITPAALVPGLNASGPALVGLLLLAAASASWAFPAQGSLLEFSRAETQFLFPAPLTRRQLLMHRLLRSQITVFFGAVIMAFAYPGTSSSGRFRAAAGMWIVLMICHVYFTGMTLARAGLGSTPRRKRWMAWAPLLVLMGAAGIVVAAVAKEIAATPVTTFREALVALGNVSMHGAPHFVLLPFVAAVRPLFSDSMAEFARAVPAAAFVYMLLVLWVLTLDEAFDSAAEAMVERHARPPTTRAGRYIARPIRWTLALTGRPEPAFIWKASLQTFRIVDRRILIRLILVLIWIIAVVLVAPRARGFAQMVGVFAAIGSGFATLMVPQILRLDLRQDLQHLELLKTWPVRGAAVVRGEIIWPAVVVTLIAWSLGGVALLFSAAVFSRTGIDWRFAIGIAAMILTPALVVAQYTIHNATALMFPAWVSVGSGRPRGVDAMGQRLILLVGTWLMLMLSLVPGVIAGGLLWVAFYRFTGPWILVPAALVCAALIALEALLATEAIGPLYEQLDITSVERPD
jgi:ABC-2 type transport system permease protein